MPAPKPVSGYLPSPPDPRDVWMDEILSGVQTSTLPPSFDDHDMRFYPQGVWPMCVAFSLCRYAEWIWQLKTGQTLRFSEAHLFFNGGGTINGSVLGNLLQVAMTQGFVLNEQLPLPSLTSMAAWDTLAAQAKTIKADPQYKIAGYVKVNPNPNDIGTAIMRYGQVMVTVAGDGHYWANPCVFLPGDIYNHETRLVGFINGQYLICQDSIQEDATFDGRHNFDPNYPFESVYALTDTPVDWQNAVADRAKVFPNNTARYGLPMNAVGEIQSEAEVFAAHNATKDQTVIDTYFRFRQLYINAATYGGYSATDLLNNTYTFRRASIHLFNFDLPR